MPPLRALRILSVLPASLQVNPDEPPELFEWDPSLVLTVPSQSKTLNPEPEPLNTKPPEMFEWDPSLVLTVPSRSNDVKPAKTKPTS